MKLLKEYVSSPSYSLLKLSLKNIIERTKLKLRRMHHKPQEWFIAQANLCMALFVLGFLVCGCSDVLTANYPSVQEAVNDGAIARGWLPDILPDTARNISERHNLDINLGGFCFYAPTYDLKQLAARLSVVPVSEFSKLPSACIPPGDCWPKALKDFDYLALKSAGYLLYKYQEPSPTNRGTTWYIAINPTKGIAAGWPDYRKPTKH